MADKIKFPYELVLFRGRDGDLSGAMVIDNPGESARGIKPDEMLPFISTLNTAALARIDSLTLEVKDVEVVCESLKAELTAYKARGLQASKAVDGILNNPDLTPEQKTAAIKSVTQDIQANERERQRLAALENLAKAQAEAAKYVD